VQVVEQVVCRSGDDTAVAEVAAPTRQPAADGRLVRAWARNGCLLYRCALRLGYRENGPATAGGAWQDRTIERHQVARIRRSAGVCWNTPGRGC